MAIPRSRRAAGVAGLRERLPAHSASDRRAPFLADLDDAAGVNAKALSTHMGHANISITLDGYGHLMPGSEDEAAGLLEAKASAIAQLELLGRMKGPQVPDFRTWHLGGPFEQLDAHDTSEMRAAWWARLTRDPAKGPSNGRQLTDGPSDYR